MTGADGKHSKSYSEDEIKSLEIFHNQIEDIISLEPKAKRNSKSEQDFEDYKKETDAKIDTLSKKYRDAVIQPITDEAITKRMEEILKKHKEL